MTEFASIDRSIIERVDIEAEAVALGIEFTSDRPGPSGWRPCRAFNRDDRNPSAAINVESQNGSRGQYKDSANGDKSIGFFEWTSRLKFNGDWQLSREYYAEVAGIDLPTNGKAARSDKTKADPVDSLDFRPWNSQLIKFVESNKPGVSEESLLAAGARIARHYNFTVIALPILGESLDPNSPVGYVVFDVMGKSLPVPGDGKPTKIKRLAVPSRVSSAVTPRDLHRIRRLPSLNARASPICWRRLLPRRTIYASRCYSSPTMADAARDADGWPRSSPDMRALLSATQTFRAKRA